MMKKGGNPVQRAYMDCIVQAPVIQRDFGVDVTIRCPFTKEAKTGWRVPGEALDIAVDDKQKTYGRSVIVLALGTFGRCGPQGMKLLRDMARALAGHSGGGRSKASFLAANWRARIGRALLWSHADGALSSLGRDTLVQARLAAKGRAGL